MDYRDKLHKNKQFLTNPLRVALFAVGLVLLHQPVAALAAFQIRLQNSLCIPPHITALQILSVTVNHIKNKHIKYYESQNYTSLNRKKSFPVSHLVTSLFITAVITSFRFLLLTGITTPLSSNRLSASTLHT